MQKTEIVLTAEQVAQIVASAAGDAPRYQIAQGFLDSEAIQKVGWSRMEDDEHGGATLGRLRVSFRGGSTYVYGDVPYVVYSALAQARSLGRMFHRLVKGKYHCEKVD